MRIISMLIMCPRASPTNKGMLVFLKKDMIFVWLAIYLEIFYAFVEKIYLEDTR